MEKCWQEASKALALHVAKTAQDASGNCVVTGFFDVIALESSTENALFLLH